MRSKLIKISLITLVFLGLIIVQISNRILAEEIIEPSPEEPNSPTTEPSEFTEPPQEEPSTIDLSIYRISPVQVVWEPDINGDKRIDLVAGKSTMVRVEVKIDRQLPPIEEPGPLPEEPPAESENSTSPEATSTESPTNPESPIVEIVRLKIIPEYYNFFYRRLDQLKEYEVFDFYLNYPLPVGKHTIMVELDPENQIPEFNENNNSTSTDITVKDTNDLYLVNFPVEDCDGYSPKPEFYNTTVSEGGEFLLGTYPIAEGEFINEPKTDKIKAGVPFIDFQNDEKCLWSPDAQIATLVKLLQAGKRATDGQADVAVGIVPETSLGDSHGIAPTKFLHFGAVLVEEKYWTITAHEVGHVYGLWRWKEEYDVYGKSKKVAPGFWVNKEFEMKEDAKCFMSWWELWRKEDWDWWISQSPEIVDTWICEDCYKNLFQEFLKDKTDPEILFISGIISRDSSIQFGPSYRFSNGTIDIGESGDYSIKIFGPNNEVIGEIPFDIRFQIHTTPGGIVETNIAPFGFSIPYTPDTSRVEIRYKEQIIAEFNPKTKLLHDAVDLIPGYGFIKNPEQRRNALHHKIDALEKMLDKNNVKGAIHKLEHDIKDKLENWLADGYPREDLLQYAKDEIIDLVNKTVEELYKIK